MTLLTLHYFALQYRREQNGHHRQYIASQQSQLQQRQNQLDLLNSQIAQLQRIIQVKTGATLPPSAQIAPPQSVPGYWTLPAKGIYHVDCFG